MTTSSANIAIYGGTFDPIHLGHLKTAEALIKEFHFEHLYFIPCKVPLLKKKAQASTEQRVAMLHLALSTYPQFKVDLCEIEREGPSYMVDTLNWIQNRDKPHSLTLVIGLDAFKDLTRWHQWERLLELANLLVLDRPNYQLDNLDPLLNALIKERGIKEPALLCQKPKGQILFYNAGHYPISATKIRQTIARGLFTNTWLPKSVADYIKSEQIYRE